LNEGGHAVEAGVMSAEKMEMLMIGKGISVKETAKAN